jgi:site-specific DNA recombinase
MIKAALYVRVSHEEQKLHGLSIDAQTTALDEWAQANGAEIIDHYIDAGITARKKHTKRPELMRLLEDVRAGKVNLIVFTKLDRWFRSVSEYYKVQEILEANNVNWKTIHEDYDTFTASGRLKINIMLSVAQDEADRAGERIKAVFDAKKARKEPVSGNVPTGYIIRNKTIEFDPEWNKAMSVFFDTYLKYASPAVARREVHRVTGKSISYQLCTLILTNRAYMGEFHGLPEMCPAYITQEQFSEIQRLRKTHPKRPNTGRVYIFGGIVHCAECGHRLAGCCQKSPHKDGTFTEIKYYNCQNHYVRGGCLSKANTMEKQIEEEVIRQLPIEWTRQKYRLEEMAEEASATPIDTGKIKRKIGRLKELYLNELIEISAYRHDYEALQRELSEMEALQKAILQKGKLYDITNYDLNSYHLLSDVDKNAFWRFVAKDITVSGNKEIKLTLKIF